MTDTQGPIGLLGGSFDPIHNGHLKLARSAFNELGLREVRFIPAGQPWQKPGLTPAAQRQAMVELAIAGEPGFVLDRCELQRGGDSYTIDTLRQLRASLGDRVPLVLLLGADQFEGLARWKEWESLAGLANLAVARRDASPAGPPAGLHAALPAELAALRRQRLQPAGQALRHPAGALIELGMPPYDCSSTRIRALARDGSPQARQALASLLPPAVLDYIDRNRLYSSTA